MSLLSKKDRVLRDGEEDWEVDGGLLSGCGCCSVVVEALMLSSSGSLIWVALKKSKDRHWRERDG